jgi:glycosyltransferase involved in cell wall biosynthesis
VALPSIEDNCPMAVLEGMAAGVPVIAANVGGVPDLIADHENGLLCDPAKAGSMGEAVRRILDDPAAARRMAEAGNAHARECFYPRNIALRHLDVYREVLQRS